MTSSHSFGTQPATNGSMSSGGSYCSGYYGDPSLALLSAATGTYSADMLLQPSAISYPPMYVADGSPSTAGCKQSYYHQEASSYIKQDVSDCQNSPSPSSTCYRQQAAAGGGYHPGTTALPTPGSMSSAAAAAAVAEATAALRLATSSSAFALKTPAAQQPAFSPLRSPAGDGFALSAARLAAGAATDPVPPSSAPAPGGSSGYSQPVGAGMTAPGYGGSAPSAFYLSNMTTADDGSSTPLHGFHPAANGFLHAAGSTSGAAYSAFQKLPTPWTTSRMSMGAYSSVDVCKSHARSDNRS